MTIVISITSIKKSSTIFSKMYCSKLAVLTALLIFLSDSIIGLPNDKSGSSSLGPFSSSSISSPFLLGHSNISVRCQHSSVGGSRVKSADCHGYVVVSTLIMEKVISCSELLKVVVVGPVSLDFGHCSYIGTGTPYCVPGGMDNIFGVRACRWSDGPFGLWTVMFILTSSLFNYILLRFLLVRFYFRFKGTVVVARSSEPIQFELSYFQKSDPHVRYCNPSDRAIAEGGPKIKAVYRFTRISFWLLALLFLKPTVKSSPVSTHDVGGGVKHIGTMFTEEGSTIDLSGWEIKVTKAEFHMILAPGYNTTTCTSSLVGDWHCTSVCYKDGEVCKGYGPTGVLKDKSDSAPSAGLMSEHKMIEYCMAGTTGCFSSNGCWKWTIDISFMKDMLHSVHGIRGSSPVLEYDILKTGDGPPPILDLIQTISTGRMCVVSRLGGKNYLCPECSHPSFPELGHIGDIQLDDSGSAIIAPRFSICNHDQWIGPSCSVSKCSLSSILPSCQELGPQATRGGYEFRDGMLILKSPKGLAIKVTTQMSTHGGGSAGGCGAASVSLWILTNSDQPAIVSVTFDNLGWGTSTIWVDPCTHERWVVPCDGGAHHHAASCPYSCYKTVRGIQVMSETGSLKSYQEDDHLMWDAGRSDGFWGENGFLQSFHAPSILGMLGINAIVIFVAVYLVCKR